LFKGFVTLVAGVAGTNQLRVQNGDIINRDVFRQLKQQQRHATATIDTVPPVISQVAATTDYYNAQVSWRHLEAGGLIGAIQRIAVARPRGVCRHVCHEITSSRSPDCRRTAFIITRSSAAIRRAIPPWTTKTEIFYTFRTLKAPAPPWFTTWKPARPAGKWCPTRQRFRNQLDARHAPQRPREQRAFGNERLGQRPRRRPEFFPRQQLLV